VHAKDRRNLPRLNVGRPGGRYDLLSVPHAVVQIQVADLHHVPRRKRQPGLPVRHALGILPNPPQPRNFAIEPFISRGCSNFANRREVAGYAGLVPTPWRSGAIAREQGISKAGSRRLRTAMIELAWLWVRHQPESVLSRWFRERVGEERGRARRIAIIALARKLLIALWRYLTHGEIPEGAILKPA
jgi:hypothetical protein